MGGYMVFRLGLLMPDRFARASSYVPSIYAGIWAYPAPPQSEDPDWTEPSITTKIVENGLNLPFEIVAVNTDEINPISGTLHQVETFEQHRNPYRFYQHPAGEHLQLFFMDEWGHTRDWLGDRMVARRPARVVYRRYPIMDLPELGHRFDGAYWVDWMVLRTANAVDDSGEVDATTFALGGFTRNVVDEGTTNSTGEGGISPAMVTGQHLASGAPIDRRNAFKATLTNLRAVLFKTRLMGLDPSRIVHVRLEGDGVTRLRFTGDWPCAVEAGALLDGSPVAVQPDETGGIRVRVNLSAPGPHHLVLGATCVASGPAVPD
jgi:hypothetical protein